jgi:hypothetical protein
MNVSDLISAIQGRRIKVTNHADEEAEDDKLLLEDIKAASLKGEVLEEYTTDTPFPSCLVLGWIGADPVHAVWAYSEDTRWAVLVTVYRPDPARWVNWRIRKKEDK